MNFELKKWYLYFEEKILLLEYWLFRELNHLYYMNALHVARSGMPMLLLLPISSLHITQKNADILPIRVSFPISPVLDFIVQRWTWCKYEPICYGQSKKLRKYVENNWEESLHRLGKAAFSLFKRFWRKNLNKELAKFPRGKVSDSLENYFPNYFASIVF